MGYVPKAMHRKAKRDGGSVKQPTHSTSKNKGNEDQFRLPSLGLGAEISSKAQVEGGNRDKEPGPENLFPPSLENAPEYNNASNSAETAYNMPTTNPPTSWLFDPVSAASIDVGPSS
jgi:hypothetical protein